LKQKVGEGSGRMVDREIIAGVIEERSYQQWISGKYCSRECVDRVIKVE